MSTRTQWMAVGLCLASLPVWAQSPTPSPAPSASARPGGRLTLEDLIAAVNTHYFRSDLPGLEEKLREGAIRGMLQKLNEIQVSLVGTPPSADPSWPWTAKSPGVNALFTPDEFRLFEDQVKGDFGGVGLMLGPPKGQRETKPPADGQGAGPHEVLKVIAGMPGEKVGIKQGDVIATVDGQPAEKIPLKDLVLKLRGPEGTTVKIGMKRAAGTVEFTVKREKIHYPSCELKVREDGLGTIAIHEFNGKTPKELKELLDQVAQKKLWGLVLDLRNCPGGTLDSALEVCGYFLRPDSVIVRIRKRGEPEQVKKTSGSQLFMGTMVVLADHRTASSGEIFTAAMKDNGRAIFAGEKTFGKGTVEMMVSLPGGYAAKITTAVFFCPSGKSPADGGVEPDVPVAMEKEPEGSHDRDPSPDEKSKAPDKALDAAYRILLFAKR
jgi:C-terminal peptidase prc